MKHLLSVLCIITFSLTLCSCKTVSVNSADELLSSSWQVTNPSGVSAELSFNKDLNETLLKITDQNGVEYIIKGAFAVDKNCLYISSEELTNTYTFGYKVFKDRLILTYNDTELTFDAVKEKEP